MGWTLVSMGATRDQVSCKQTLNPSESLQCEGMKISHNEALMMTLVCLTYFNGKFLAISDSRISWGQGGKLEKFTKIFSHRYRFTCGHPYTNPPESYSGEIGLAFSGSTLFGLAFSSIFSRAILEMHSFELISAPNFDAFKKIADHCAGKIGEYVLGKEQCFEVLIFGFDPRGHEPKVIRLMLGPGSDGVSVSSQISDAVFDKIETIGTGAKHLPQSLPPPSTVPLSIYVSEVVSSKADPATGGDIQAMELTKASSRFFGTMIAGKSWDDANYYGVNRGELGDVEGFRVGRSDPIILTPYAAISQLAADNARYIKDAGGEPSKGAGNVAPLMSFLSVIHQKASSGVLESSYQFDRSPLVPGNFYFAKVCPSCWLNSPSIISPAAGERFRGKVTGSGKVVTSCQFCNGPIEFFAADFLREVRW